MRRVILVVGGALLIGFVGCQASPSPDQGRAKTTPTEALEALWPVPMEGEADCFVMVDGEPDYGAPPLTVRFVSEANCTATPITYAWDFGDGATDGNVPHPSHTYERAGEYVAVVRVTAPDGGASDDELDIVVEASLD